MAGAASITFAGARDLPEHWRLAVLAGSLAVAACAGFAALAGAAALCLWFMGSYHDTAAYALLLAVKTLALSTLTGAALLIANRYANQGRGFQPVRPARLAVPNRRAARAALLAAPIFLAAALVFPRLHAYPWTAPDELHHLIVARNLAEHNAYASGHPDVALKYFDYYDSVGPTVLGPVAAAFRLFGTDIAHARAVIGGFFLLLLASVYMLTAPTYGRTAATVSTLFVTVAASSVYLARSVYGEVPAMVFFVIGLVAWRRQIATGALLPAFGAGACLGLAALTKLFIAITAPAFLLLWWYDRRTARRITTQSVVLMAAGTAFVWLAWGVVEWRYRHLVTSDLSPIVYYRHMLLFGFESAPAAIAEFLRQPFGALGAMLTFAIAFPPLLRRDDEAPLIVLLLSGLIFGFWWLFFSSGHIPRYLWYFWVIAAVFTGPVLQDCLVRMRNFPRSDRNVARFAAAGLAFLLVAPALGRFAGYVDRVYRYEELGDEIALGEYLSAIPDGAAIATTWWPAERSANFFAHRPIVVAEADAPQTGWLVRNAVVENVPQQDLARAERIGRYAILPPPTTQEAD